MFFSSVEMADEWLDDVDTGKTYCNTKTYNNPTDADGGILHKEKRYNGCGRGRGGWDSRGGGSTRGGSTRGGLRGSVGDNDVGDNYFERKKDFNGDDRSSSYRKNGSFENGDQHSSRDYRGSGSRNWENGDERGRGRGSGRGRGRGRGGVSGGRDGGGGDSNRQSGDFKSNRINDNDKGNNDCATEEKLREVYIPPEPTDDESEIFGTAISSGINFSKYDSIKVKVSGNDPPEPIDSFENSGLNSFLLENIKKSGYLKPTPIQKTAIPTVLTNRDLMACAQTGSGKTAAFLLPIINTLLEDNRDLEIGHPHVVIVSPTRELTTQIFNEARKFAMHSFLKICLVYGGTSSNYQSQNVAKGCHILVATPGRLIDFVNKSFVSFDHVRFIVLDEADRMLDMGFLPEVEKIMNHVSMVEMKQRQTCMFSATFPEEIQRLAGQFLHDYIFITVGIVGMACDDVEQIIYEVTKFEKRKKLVEILDEEDSSGTIVFVETRRNADFLATFLCEKTKHMTTSIHGVRLQSQREQALRDFKTNKMQVLVATSVIARGLDIKNVRHVINFDLPKDIDEYVHRIGRTGRVGNRGKASSLYDPGVDAPLTSDLIKILKQANQHVPEFLGISGGDGGYNGKSTFGGRDVRRMDKNDVPFQPSPLEPEETW